MQNTLISQIDLFVYFKNELEYLNILKLLRTPVFIRVELFGSNPVLGQYLLLGRTRITSKSLIKIVCPAVGRRDRKRHLLWCGGMERTEYMYVESTVGFTREGVEKSPNGKSINSNIITLGQRETRYRERGGGGVERGDGGA